MNQIPDLHRRGEMSPSPVPLPPTWRRALIPVRAAVAAVLAIGLPAPVVAQGAPPSPPAEWVGPGAAYRTGKSMLFGLRRIEVVGITDSIGVTLEPRTSGAVEVVATIDPSGFDSGNDSRDEWVRETLGGPELELLVFRSDPVAVDDLLGVLAGRPLRLDGRLELPDGPRPVRFDVGVYELALPGDEGVRRYLEAWARTTFDALGIEVPDVGPAGVIASPGDDLELWLRLPVTALPEPGSVADAAISPPGARASPSRPPSSSSAPSFQRR